MYTADENLNDIEEAALAYRRRGNVFAHSWESLGDSFPDSKGDSGIGCGDFRWTASPRTSRF